MTWISVLALQPALEGSTPEVGHWFERGVSLLGLAVLVGIAFLLSVNRAQIRWRPVMTGIGLQFGLALIILKTRPGLWIFDQAKAAFQKLLEFSSEGAEFVFGVLGEIPVMSTVFNEPQIQNQRMPDFGFVFAVQVASTIIFVSSLMAVFYHLGIMQRIVYAMAVVMQRVMRTSGAESLAAAANVFVGQTEAPLTVRPYLGGMTSSELTALMCGGMATVAGGVLAAYVGMGVDAGHLLAASVMSAPAALVIAKIMVPETERSQTAGDVPLVVERSDSNLLDAACRGAGDGLKLSLNVMAMLIAFISLVAMLNFLLSGIHGWFLPAEVVADADLFKERALSLERILSYLFCPLAWVMGVEWKDALSVGQLLGEKMVINEFFAFISLTKLEGVISERSTMISTYALCGFANFSSIAIQIGGIGALEPGIRTRLARLGLRAMLGGTLAAMMTATIAGVLIAQ